jgi:hypothetical protein
LDIKREAEATIQKTRDEIFLKYLDPKTQYITIGKILAGAGVDIVVPGASAVAALAEETIGFFGKKKKRWQGFIVSSRYLWTKK